MWFGITAATLLAVMAGAAQAGCEGQTIVKSRIPSVDFYDQNGKVIQTMKDKTADNSLNLRVEDCDGSNYYVLLPGNVPAAVHKGDVVTDAGLDGLPPCPPNGSQAAVDTTRRGGNGAVDGGLCKPQ